MDKADYTWVPGTNTLFGLFKNVFHPWIANILRNPQSWIKSNYTFTENTKQTLSTDFHYTKKKIIFDHFWAVEPDLHHENGIKYGQIAYILNILICVAKIEGFKSKMLVLDFFNAVDL